MGIGRISNCLQDEWAHAFFFYCWIISSRQQLPSLLLPTPQKICHTADDDSILDSRRSKSSRNWLTVQPTKEVALYKENTKLKRKRFFVHRNLYSVGTQCLKITENVLFNIASEASYVYILNGQKFIKNDKNAHLGEFLKTWSLRSNSFTRQVTFNRTKMVKIPKLKKLKCDILDETMWEGCVIFNRTLDNEWRQDHLPY